MNMKKNTLEEFVEKLDILIIVGVEEGPHSDVRESSITAGQNEA